MAGSPQHPGRPDEPGGRPRAGHETKAGEGDHLYRDQPDPAGGPVEGSDYGRVRGPDGQNPDQVIQGGENHSYGGYGSDYVRRREEFGSEPREGHHEQPGYAPPEPPEKGSGVGAFGQGGDVGRPDAGETHRALAPDEHPGILQPDGERRRPD